MRKVILITKQKIVEYQRQLALSESSFPVSFLLTLWQYFDVSKVTSQSHVLLEQSITLHNTLQFEVYYDCYLDLVDVIDKKKAQIWLYQLTVKRKEVLYAQCQTKIYVQKNR